MNKRIATFIIGGLDAVAWAVIAMSTYRSDTDPEGMAYDHAAGIVVTGLFLITGLPALLLALINRLPKTALSFALAFPILFAVLFVAVAAFFMFVV